MSCFIKDFKQGYSKNEDKKKAITDSLYKDVAMLSEEVDKIKQKSMQDSLRQEKYRKKEENRSEKIAQLERQVEKQNDSIEALRNTINAILEKDNIVIDDTLQSQKENKLVKGSNATIVEEESLEKFILVVEAHRDKMYSTNIAERWSKKGYDVGITHSKTNSWYYIYIADYNSKSEAQKKINELRKLEIKDVWLYEQ